MRILLFYTYNQGFLSSFYFEISARLVEDGHEVFNFSLKPNAKKFQKEGVNVIIKKRGGYFKNYWETYKVIKKLKPNVILSNFSHVNPALLFGRFLGVKHNMAWFHSLNDQMNPSRFKVIIKSMFLRLADKVIANSHITEAELNQTYRIAENNLAAVSFWTNIAERNNLEYCYDFDTSDTRLKIGCPGRITIHKNQKVVLEALKKFNPDSFQLFYAGSGDGEDSLKSEINRSKLKEVVVLLGHLSPSKMLHFYQEMDIIILPSLAEAFGLVFIESLALGKPTLVSKNFGALNYIKDEKVSNISFDPTRPEELYSRIKLFFDGNGLPPEFFKRLYTENFEKEKIYEQLSWLILNT